jgi:hypothetical protein
MNPWKNHNLDGLQPGHLLDMVATAARIIAEHGFDPCTKAQAAAHETGHCIVACALGENVLGARIWQDNDGHWVGINKRGDGKDRAGFYAHERPAEAFRQACNLFAGVAGEDMAGHYHPASSIDEREKARAICAELDDISGSPDGTTQLHAANVVQAILTRYRPQFDTVRLHLMQQRRLTPKEASRMLAKVGEL